MKKKFMAIIALAIACVSLFAFTACGNNDSGNGNSETKEKNVTVIAREQASGTREAFDKVVTDGNGNFLNMKDANGKTVYSTTSKATLLDGTGAVLSSVASDENAIGYISLGSVDDTVKVVKVNGVAPSKTTVLDGTYSIQRPFVVMTNKAVTPTPLAEDFLKFLKSSEMQAVCDADGVIFLTDEAKRANEGETPIAVGTFEKLATIPSGKIVLRGSTSMEKVIDGAVKAYAAIYGVEPGNIVDKQLQGSSVGKSEAKKDAVGNVIGLSSAAVKDEKLNSFNLCLDAVAVIVNNKNDKVDNLTIKNLYDIYTGKIVKFSEIK